MDSSVDKKIPTYKIYGFSLPVPYDLLNNISSCHLVVTVKTLKLSLSLWFLKSGSAVEMSTNKQSILTTEPTILATEPTILATEPTILATEPTILAK